MNRYALFLILVGVQANITLPEKTPYYKWPEETKAVADEIDSRIDYEIGDNLSKEERATVAGLKAVCNEHLRKFMNNLNRIEKISILTATDKETNVCLENFAKAKKLNKHKDYSQEETDILKKKATSKIRNKIRNKSGRKGDIAYLVKGPIGENVFKDAEKLCDEQREYLNNQGMDDNNEIIQRSFKDTFNYLNSQEQTNAAPLLNQCNEYLQIILNGLPYDSYDRKYKEARSEIIHCIAEYARIEAENNYAKETKMEEYNKEKGKALGLTTRDKVQDAFFIKKLPFF